jgi:hypothetical protein
MPRSASEIPDLKLVRLQKLIESFKMSPNLVLMKLFGSINADSDEIKWESQVGTKGMTPFVSPTAKAPTLAPLGVGQHSAFAAFWKEKMYMGELWLNNLRQPGTVATYETAQRKLAREMNRMRNRSDRRREWMFSKMLTAGSFDYLGANGVKLAVDYDIPTANIVTLAANRKWSTGVSRNAMEDIFDAKLDFSNGIGASIDYAFMTTEVLKYLVFDPGIQTLLSKSNFGQGDLLANPLPVLSGLLKLPNLFLYDEQFELRSWITAAVTGSSTTTVYVDDATDFEVGDTLRFIDVSAVTFEDETISAVDADAGTITVASAPTASFKAGEDCVQCMKKFVPTNKFCMFASTVEGENIAEYMNAPFGLDRHYGMKVDQETEWDPEGMWIRTQNKGLPVLYNRDAVYIMTVA